jgi:hypothetical protein
VGKSHPPRFDDKLNRRWIEGGKRLFEAWSDRHGAGADDIRAAIFNLYSIALETADSDCLRLGEALACAADRLDDAAASPRLAAALSSAVDCLGDPEGLEHPAFSERARHFALRLETASSPADSVERSPVLDQLFVDEACERLESLRDALNALPPDAYVLLTEALGLAQHAEMLELWGIMHLARQLADGVNRHANELDSSEVQEALHEMLCALSAGIGAIEI